MLKRIIHVVGARPNFIKAAPVLAALARREGFAQTLVHTGQHYDANMSDVFFRQLGMPPPDVNLEVGSGSHAAQTAGVMLRFEETLSAMAKRPDMVLVYGDVNSTMAAALVCSKLQIPVGHVEAGLRAYDRRMPEEINRLLTDQLADLLFTPSMDGNENLLCEGIAAKKIHLVGNVMIDTLVRLLPQAEARWPALRGELPVAQGVVDGDGYALVTLHRPSNVDEPATLQRIVEALFEIARRIPVIFPAHPRTREHLRALTPEDADAQLYFVEPLGYLDFLILQHRAALVITDSGGIQEETTFLGVPCLTVRENTERPITVGLGTNVLVGQDMKQLCAEVANILEGRGKRGQIPPLWDGAASERIADVLADW